MTTETRATKGQDRAAAESPPLTLFSTPKAFTGIFGEIQRTAIRSWLELRPECQVLLVGDDEGVAEAAADLGVEHLGGVARNAHGTPLLDDVFRRARAGARGRLLAYLNCDLILGNDFVAAARLLEASGEPFVMVGECWDVDPSAPGGERTRRGRDALDFFVFPPSLFHEIPPFAIGRTGFDNWLLWRAAAEGARVVDVTHEVDVLHQRHDYSHLPRGKTDAYHGAETRENWRLAGGKRHFYSLLDATHTLEGGRIRRRLAATFRAASRANSARGYASRVFARARRT